MGRREEALEELRRYLASGPEIRDRARIEDMVERLESGGRPDEEVEP
jgi:chorismate mutase